MFDFHYCSLNRDDAGIVLFAEASKPENNVASYLLSAKNAFLTKNQRRRRRCAQISRTPTDSYLDFRTNCCRIYVFVSVNAC